MSLKKERPDNTDTDNYVSDLKKDPDEKSWSRLSEVTLTQITLFNRRRVGEIERITRKNCNSGITNDSQVQEEIASSISPLEQELLKTMAKVEMQGKKVAKLLFSFTRAHPHQMELLNTNIQLGNINIQ